MAYGFGDGTASEAKIQELGVSVGLEIGDGGAVVGLRQPAAAAAESLRRLVRRAPGPGADAGLEQLAGKPGIRQETRIELQQVMPQTRTLDPGEKTGYQ